MPTIQKLVLLSITALSTSLPLHAADDIQSFTSSTDLAKLQSAIALIKKNQVDYVGDANLINECINGMARGKEGRGSYLYEERLKELAADSKTGGIGVEIGIRNGYPVIISSIDDSPADKAGLQSGDVITKIDNVSTLELPLSEIVKILQGKVDSKISIVLNRNEFKEPLSLTLKREAIKNTSVKTKLLETGYGYIRISQFRQSTGEQLGQAIEKLYKDNRGNLRGLIVDLRNNPGGLLTSAVAVSAAFLPENELVLYTESPNPDAKMKLMTIKEHYNNGSVFSTDYYKKLPMDIKNVPLVVLVNQGSASASEIVAGALQDYKRATIIGAETYGLASIQSILPMDSNSALKITTAHWFTPKGRSVVSKGLTPDITIPSHDKKQSKSLLESDEAVVASLKYFKNKI